MLRAAKLQMQSHSSDFSGPAQYEARLHAARVNLVISINYFYLVTAI